MADGFDIVSYLMGKQVGGGGGGGGGFGYTKLAEQDFTVNTSSTTATNVGTISCGASAWTSAKMVYVRVRDKAGKRDGYFYGSDSFISNFSAAGSSSLNNTTIAKIVFAYINSAWKGSASSFGVYFNGVTKDGEITIMSKYSSSYGTIDGTYHVEVYALDWPDGVSPFE